MWQHENYFAPFDFPIQKTADELSAERKEIKRNTDVYYRYNSKIVVEVQQQYQEKFDIYFPSCACRSVRHFLPLGKMF